jgi:hypothetical protein
VKGRKISGNAAGLYEDAQALVGNLLLEFPHEEMIQILKVPNEKFREKVRKLMESGVTSVKDQLGFVPPRDELIQVFIECFESQLNIQLTPTTLHPDTLALMYNLQNISMETEWPTRKYNQTKTNFWKVKIHSDAHVVQGRFHTSNGWVQIQCSFQDTIIDEIHIIEELGIIPNPILLQLEQYLTQIDLIEVNLATYINSFLSQFDLDNSTSISADLAQSLLQTYKKTSRGR